MEDDLFSPKDNNTKPTLTLFDTKEMTAKEIYGFLIARAEEREKAQDEESDETAKGNKD